MGRPWCCVRARQGTVRDLVCYPCGYLPGRNRLLGVCVSEWVWVSLGAMPLLIKSSYCVSAGKAVVLACTGALYDWYWPGLLGHAGPGSKWTEWTCRTQSDSAVDFVHAHALYSGAVLRRMHAKKQSRTWMGLVSAWWYPVRSGLGRCGATMCTMGRECHFRLCFQHITPKAACRGDKRTQCTYRSS